ncbi:hypothetical protein HN587_03400 [Candidatus Woesearchaeota archaeon]|jgi:hypothetical protein|nr:hypothetical protein [Candidatus Woesearchaeota archaeon]
MKSIRDLKSTYDGADIANLVEFASRAPIMLPPGNYHLEKKGNTAHVYEQTGINNYNIVDLPPGLSITGLKNTTQGTEIRLSSGEGLGGVELIILHSMPHSRTTNTGTTYSQNRSAPTNYGESRPSSLGESRPNTNLGESRASSLGESRASSFGESRPSKPSRSYGCGESRSSGESRW